MDQFYEEIPDNISFFFADFKMNMIGDNKTRLSGSCKVCKKRITIDWKPTRVTSNFISHSKLCGGICFRNYEVERGKKRKNSQQDVDASANQPLTEYFRQTSKVVSDDRVDDAIVKCSIIDMLPLNIVEKDGFRFLMSVLRPSHNLPTRAKFTSDVLNQCRQVVSAIEKSTNGSQYCCAQADIWSSRRMRGFIGVSLSYIHNHKMETRLVSMKRFMGSHTAENIADVYQNIIKRFASQTTVVGIVTDNAANMVKAFPKPIVGTEAVENDIEEQEVAGDEVNRHLPIDWELLEQEQDCPLPVRYACMAHTLQLVIQSAFTEASSKINNIMAKCDNFVNSVHKSCRATELLESQAAMQIPASNSTRWNSKLLMISAFLKVESQSEGIILRICKMMSSKISFSIIEFAVLREIEQLLSPFEVATVRMQSEVVVTSSQILPTVVGLLKHLEKLEVRHCTSIKSGLLSSLNNRCGHLFRQAHYLIATAVDPRFKLRWTTNNGDSSAAREAVLNEMHNIRQKTPGVQAPHGSLQQTESSIQQPDILFSYMNENSSTEASNAVTELVCYLSSPCSSLEPLVYWSDAACQKSFPTLYTLHLKHHCIPATSANVERVFSAAGYIASARRNRLGDESLELLVIAKCNKDHLMRINF